jgi:hypothetical protein
MIIWINGSFGAGKTQTAFELNRRLPGSYVLDPERFGFFIQRSLPPYTRKKDFQDYTIWRTYITETLRHLDTHYKGVVLVPMTLVEPAYFHEIITVLRQEGCNIHHFALTMPEDEIRRRLVKRGDKPGSWNFNQVDKCVKALLDPLFDLRLNTASKSVEETAEEIAAACGLSLSRRSGLWQGRVHRLWTQLKHIRR